MQMSQLKAASEFAKNYGCKAIAYGGPGSGKTPLVMTAPRPVLLVVEPGMLSMREAKNVPAWEAYTLPRINEFFDWFFKSAEAKNFDTLCIDSISQVAEIILAEKLRTIKHGMQAYGEMAEDVNALLSKLYFMQHKHMYMIAKQATVEQDGVQYRRPYFPGKDLNIKVPHLFDLILHLRKVLIPGQLDYVTAACTKETRDAMARDRSGKLAEFEFPDLAKIFAKTIMD